MSLWLEGLEWLSRVSIIQQTIYNRVQQLVGTAVTKCIRIEQIFPSPSEYARGARSCDVNDHIHPSGSGLHVYKPPSEGDFIDAMNVKSTWMHTMANG